MKKAAKEGARICMTKNDGQTKITHQSLESDKMNTLY